MDSGDPGSRNNLNYIVFAIIYAKLQTYEIRVICTRICKLVFMCLIYRLD